jgi:hypothetical protein
MIFVWCCSLLGERGQPLRRRQKRRRRKEEERRMGKGVII